MTDESVALEIRDTIGHVTLTAPERGNPFDVQMCTELALIATECDENPAVRAVVIDAAGPFFSVGLDIKAFVANRDQMPIFAKNATAGMNTALSRFARMDAPVVVAAAAMVVGGGTALVAAGDFAVVGRSVKFYSAYCGAGVSCDVGGTYYLPRRIGVRATAEFLMRNQTWTADEALARGLVTSVVEDSEVDKVAWELAVELAAGPTRAYGEIKNLLLSTWDQPLETQLDAEARAMARISRTDDAYHAMIELAARRKPVFEGR